jgi:hypothetical protein
MRCAGAIKQPIFRHELARHANSCQPVVPFLTSVRQLAPISDRDNALCFLWRDLALLLHAE